MASNVKARADAEAAAKAKAAGPVGPAPPPPSGDAPSKKDKKKDKNLRQSSVTAEVLHELISFNVKHRDHDISEFDKLVRAQQD